MSIKRYTSIPQEIDAVHWTGSNHAGRALIDWLPDKVTVTGSGTQLLMLLAGVDGAQGWVPVPIGHWVVSRAGDTSDVWPVDPDYFAAKYRAGEERADGGGDG